MRTVFLALLIASAALAQYVIDPAIGAKVFTAHAGSNGFKFIRQLREYGNKVQILGGFTPVDESLLRHAMAYGTALASFNVEEFGTERVARLTGEEIATRVHELARITHFSDAPIELRG